MHELDGMSFTVCAVTCRDHPGAGLHAVLRTYVTREPHTTLDAERWALESSEGALSAVAIRSGVIGVTGAS